MVSTVRLAAVFALLGCLVGCAAEPTPPKETPVDESSIPSHSASSKGAVTDHDVPVTPVVANDSAVPTTPTKAPAPVDTTSATKTQTCTSTTGGYKSLTTVSYTVENGTATIEKMTVDVTNVDGRDKNDVDVYTTPAGGDETKDFNSGDILVHGETVEVPQAKSMTLPSGAKVRIATNFDRAFATDPSASCTIQF